MISLQHTFVLGQRLFCRFRFRSILLFIVLLALMFGVFFLKENENENENIVRQKENEVHKEDLPTTQKIDKETEQAHVGDKDKKKRQNLIIVTHGRSGSTFLGNIFNHHPNVFYLFEPYQTVERLHHGEVAPKNKDYQAKSFQWMKGIFQCDFVSLDHVKDLQGYYQKKYPGNYNPLKSLSLLSPPFCPYNTTDSLWSMEGCPPLDQKTLETTCKSKYNLTVVKVLMWRMPGESIKQLLSICDTDEFDCKFLFLVRDPRGIIPSSKAVGFYSEKNSLDGTKTYSQKICRTTQINLNIIRSLSLVEKKRLMLLRYEELAENPMKILPSLMKFAGLPMDESLKKWLYLASHLPETESEREAARWRQDSWEGAQRWRWKVGSDVINVIENFCSHVMSVLGYKAVGGSHVLKNNLTVRLLEDRYEALQWF